MVVILSTHWNRDVLSSSADDTMVNWLDCYVKIWHLDCLGSMQPLVKLYNKMLIITGNITEVWDQTSEESKLKWLSSLIREEELNHFTDLPTLA